MASTSEIGQSLQRSMSSDPNTRISAELKISELLANSDAGLSLSHIILAQEADISLRQMSDRHLASIVLRKYVTERWSPYFPAFKGNAPSVEIKDQIRQAVFHGLSDPNRKMRSSCAHTLSSIANCDWPEEYPDLLTSLISLLSSNSPDSVHGAMQVLTEFIKSDLTEDQILPVLRDLLPVLLSILGATEQHTALTRARTISVFRQCVAALFMVKDQHPQSVKEATASLLPVWLEAFKVLLNHDAQRDVANNDNWDGLAIRIQIFKTLDTIHTSFPRALTPYLKDFLAASLQHLQSLFPTFTEFYLTSSASPPGSSEDEFIGLPHLICPIIDFMSSATRGGRAKEWFDSGNLQALVHSLFRYVQMTEEDEETWAVNANAFVAQEEDETQAYSVRVAGFDLLGVLVERWSTPTCVTLQATIQQIIATSGEARNAGVSDWHVWRSLEAGLAAMGSQAEAILDCVEEEEDSERAKPIDIEYLLSDVVPSILTLSEFPFLQGRGFVFASQYTKLLPAQLAGQYLEAAIQVIESPNAGIPVKISAVKAIHNFCEGADDAALVPFVSRIAKDLGPFLLETTEDTLSLVLETLSVVVEVDGSKWLTQDLAHSLVLAVLEVWTKNNKDPIFLSIFTDIFASMAASSAPGIYETVVKQALPTLCTAIGSATLDESWIAGSAIDLVTSLVKGAPEHGLGDGFFPLLAPNLFHCLKQAEDRDVLQNGVVCLTLVIRKDCPQLLSWTDTTGETGIANVLAVVARLLQNEDESGGLVIGDLIIHLLRRAGESVLPVLPELLHAMIGRMTSAKTATFLQSLVIPFAFLINNQRDTVLDLLESTNIQERSSLDIFINTWCENAETFQGFWPTRISTLALSQLYLDQRQSLQNLMVKGDIIVKPETRDVIMTRSRTKTTPHEFTSVPFPVKALKLLVHDLRTNGESATMNGQTFDVDSDDGDEEWAEEENATLGLKEEEFAFLSDMLGPKGMAFDNDD
ncbi:ARM repeat-containing protein, partial [Athelia psychrophila]